MSVAKWWMICSLKSYAMKMGRNETVSQVCREDCRQICKFKSNININSYYLKLICALRLPAANTSPPIYIASNSSEAQMTHADMPQRV